MKHSEEKLQEEKIQRWQVLINFAYIESLIKDFITFHYFGNKNPNFQTDFLENESFSFFLLKRAFYKILARLDLLDTFPKKDLDEMNEYRNIMAHSMLKIHTRKTDLGLEYGSSFLQHWGKEYQMEDIVKKYDKLKIWVQKALEWLPGISTQRVNLIN